MQIYTIHTTVPYQYENPYPFARKGEYRIEAHSHSQAVQDFVRSIDPGVNILLQDHRFPGYSTWKATVDGLETWCFIQVSE